ATRRPAAPTPPSASHTAVLTPSLVPQVLAILNNSHTAPSPSQERICEIRCRSSSAIFYLSPLRTAGDTVHGQEGPHLKLVEPMGDGPGPRRARGAHRRSYGWFPGDQQCGRDERPCCSYRHRVSPRGNRDRR